MTAIDLGRTDLVHDICIKPWQKALQLLFFRPLKIRIIPRKDPYDHTAHVVSPSPASTQQVTPQHNPWERDDDLAV